MKLRRQWVIVMSIMVIIVWGEFVRAQVELKPANGVTRMIDLSKNKYFEQTIVKGCADAHANTLIGKVWLTALNINNTPSSAFVKFTSRAIQASGSQVKATVRFKVIKAFGEGMKITIFFGQRSGAVKADKPGLYTKVLSYQKGGNFLAKVRFIAEPKGTNMLAGGVASIDELKIEIIQ